MTTQLSGDGTRFRVYCQPSFLGPQFEAPVTVSLQPPAGTVGKGPCDDRIRVVDALGKTLYADQELPPYRGAVNPPAEPGPDGHFDHLEPGTTQFDAAHAYAGLRIVLDVWEGYAGEPVQWFFADDYAQLEVIPRVDWENGQAGYGFIELGHAFSASEDKRAFALNFDVLAHEMGHIILASEVGMPLDDDLTQYRGFQESASDIIALLSVLHFDHFVDYLLAKTHGNLYARNELNTLAELSPNEQIRAASHGLRMTDIEYAWVPSRYLTQKQIHKLAQPFTAAMFDVLVEIFHELLVQAEVISRSLDDLSTANLADENLQRQIQQEFDQAYADAPEEFRRALTGARDLMGERLIKSWRRLDVDSLTLWSAAVEFMTVDRELTGMTYQNIIRDCFRWRRFEP